MTDKLDTPKIGDLVCVQWPGSSTGDNRKWGKLARETSTRIGLQVGATTPRGEYTGALGSEVRWFVRAELVRAAVTECPAPLRPELSESQTAELARLEAKAERKEARAELAAEKPAKKAKP